jgi:general secretion pathway protein M
MNVLRTTWRARSPREQSALALGGAAVLLLLLFGFVWEPLRAEEKRLRESLPHLRLQSAQFAADAVEARRLREMGRVTTASELPRATIEAAAAETGVRSQIRSVTDVAAGRFQVALEPVPYEALIQWVGALASDAGIAVESLQMHAGPRPGTVVVDTLVLKGPGSEP